MLQISPELIAKMPTNTLGVLCMYALGIDIKKKLAEGTYYRHQSILLAYGYDVSKPAGSQK